MSYLEKKEKDLTKINSLTKHLVKALGEECTSKDYEVEIAIHAVTALFTSSSITYFGKETTVEVLQDLIKNIDLL